MLVDVKLEPSPAPEGWTVDTQAGTATLVGPGYQEDYQWTVPGRIEPAGTRIEWGGQPSGNAAIEIQPFGDGGLIFDTTDLGRPPERRRRGSQQLVRLLNAPVVRDQHFVHGDLSGNVAKDGLSNATPSARTPLAPRVVAR